MTGQRSVQQIGAVLASAASTLLIGIYVYGQVQSAIPTPDQSWAANVSAQVTATTSNAFVLAGVSLIVLVATIILGLMGATFAGGGSGRAPDERPRNPRKKEGR